MLRSPMPAVPMRASCAVAVIAVMILLAGCGSSSKPATTTSRPSTATIQAGGSGVISVTLPDLAPPTPAAIRRAARLTAAEPGYRARVSAEIRIPQFGAGPLTAVGSGYFDAKSATGTVNVALGLPGLLGLAGSQPSQLIAIGDEAYVKLPSDLLSIATTLRPWQRATLAQLDLSTLNPSVIFGQVARDATRKVPGQQAQVTIDAKTGLIHTIVLTYYVPGPRIHIRVHLTLTGFGHEPVSVAPPADHVGQLLPALKALGL